MGYLETYKKLRDNFGEKLEKAMFNAEITSWNFYTNSTHENMHKYSTAQEEMSELYKDKDLYKKLKEIKEIGFEDKQLNKELKDLVKAFYNEIESGEELKALRNKENEIANKFNSYVMTLNSKPISKAEISKILETETNSTIRKLAYETNIKAGDIIADDLVELVKMRNDYAKQKGYDNYFKYSVEELYDINADKLDLLLDGVYKKVSNYCANFYKKRQNELSKAFDIPEKELMDYHYGLLTSKNPQGTVNKFLKTKEQVVEIAIKTYKNMGFCVDNMGITLDLFPRKNKNTHGFAFCIKPGKDARILANLTNNANSLDTILHELGHCVYDMGIDTTLPFIEQDCSSPVMTEAIAMMMGDLPKSEKILSGIVPDEILEPFRKELREDDGKFVTRSLQIINFEKELYNDPNQDLKLLWKKMKQKYLYRGENTEINNEWATIPHYLSHPGYYQNYFRAGLLKAQIYRAMRNKLGNISENPESSKFLNEKLFKYGASVWEDDLIIGLSGKSLSEDDFCNSIIGR